MRPAEPRYVRCGSKIISTVVTMIATKVAIPANPAAPALTVDQHGQPVQAEVLYCCQANAAPRRDDGSLPRPQEILISGTTLLAMSEGSFDTPDIRREARALLRLFLNEILGGEPLATRDLLSLLGPVALGEPS